MKLNHIIASLLLTACVTAGAQQADIVWIGLANQAEDEAVTAAELRAVIRKHDVESWMLTNRIIIDRTRIPHSHPVLTIHTRHIGNEIGLMSTFVHEQLHWLQDEPWLERFQAAMDEFEAVFPEVPSSREGGARDRRSTYRHLLVCDMELQAMTTLVGEAAARETLAAQTHYEWIYDKVLNDPRVRVIVLKHGFDVSAGVRNL